MNKLQRVEPCHPEVTGSGLNDAGHQVPFNLEEWWWASKQQHWRWSGYWSQSSFAGDYDSCESTAGGGAMTPWGYRKWVECCWASGVIQPRRVVVSQRGAAHEMLWVLKPEFLCWGLRFLWIHCRVRDMTPWDYRKWVEWCWVSDVIQPGKVVVSQQGAAQEMEWVLQPEFFGIEIFAKVGLDL